MNPWNYIENNYFWIRYHTTKWYQPTIRFYWRGQVKEFTITIVSTKYTLVK